MTPVEKFGLMMLEKCGRTSETAEWKFNTNFVFGVDVIDKKTGKVLMHTHASFPQTDDLNKIAEAMIQMENSPKYIAIDIDNGVHEGNYQDHLDNPRVQKWLNNRGLV